MVGMTLTDKAYTSTSKDGRVADNFTGDSPKSGAILQITVPSGTRYLDMDKVATPGHAFGGEKEILLGRGNSYNITKVSRNSNGVAVFHATYYGKL